MKCHVIFKKSGTQRWRKREEENGRDKKAVYK